MPSASDPQKFWLQVPVARSFAISCSQCRFNDPRDYNFAPNKLQKHEGIDLTAQDPSGQPVAVLAAQRGTVDFVGFNPQGYGNYVRVTHPWHDATYVTWYGHLSQVSVRPGQYLRAGDQIGIAGNTGFTFGNVLHVHLTLQKLGQGLDNYVVDDVIDPESFFVFGTPPAMNEATFISDVTVADGSIMQPGQTFTKTWRIRNTGNTTWDSNFRLAHVDGSRMAAPASVALPPAAPGALINVSVTFTAPSRPGRYVSTWRPRDGQGNTFNYPLTAEIVVIREGDRNEARFVADVTVADGTVIPAGQPFLKTWRIRNSGNTAWTTGYRLAFFGDNRMGGPDSVPLPPANPGDEVDVSVTLTAPATSGIHRSTWKPMTPQGDFFEFEHYAEIRVPAPLPPGNRLDQARYVTDVTIPDGTIVQAGQPFTKTWRIRNSGTTTWGPGYELAFFSDDQMGSATSVPLPPAAPGQTVDVSIILTAPATPGRYASTWKPRNPQGQFFDFEMFADVRVAAPIPPSNRLDEARFVRDVTIPDGTVLQAGQPFTKAWRIRNSGTTTWGPGYDLAFFGDQQLGGPASTPLPPLEPGEEGLVWVFLTAPTTPGRYISTWKPRNPQDQFFEFEMFADVVIRTAPPPPQRDDAAFVDHVTVPAGAKLQPAQSFTKTWRIRNSGDTTWGNGYTLAFDGGEQLGGPESVALSTVEPGKSTNVSVTLTARATPGRYEATWRVRNPAGHTFGAALPLAIEVVDDDQTVDLLPFLRGDGRLYELRYTWGGGGQQTIQTQRGGTVAGRERFYHVKNSEWEELFFDDNYIYRGTDTSPGGGNFYSLSENGQHGSPWIPRHMTPQTFFRRSPLVTFRRKDSCQVVNNFIHVTWIRLEAVHDTFTLPSGLTLNDVAELAGYVDDNGRPAAAPFERYFYAVNYGLVAWQGGGVGQSFLVGEHPPGSRPDLVREVIPCL